MRHTVTYTMVFTPADLAIINALVTEGEYRDFSAFMTAAVEFELQQDQIYPAMPDLPHHVKSVSIQKDLKKQIDRKVHNNEYLNIGEYLRHAIRIFLHAQFHANKQPSPVPDPSGIHVEDHLYTKITKNQE